MPRFIRSTIIHAPVETVFGFHEREDALQLLSPPFPPVRVIERQGGIETGARVELKIGFTHWIAIHTGYQRNHFFEDRQLRGPFALWIHRHEFQAIGNTTRLTDSIEYQLPGGRWINYLFGWTVLPGLH